MNGWIRRRWRTFTYAHQKQKAFFMIMNTMTSTELSAELKMNKTIKRVENIKFRNAEWIRLNCSK